MKQCYHWLPLTFIKTSFLRRDSYTHLKPSVWICHPSESVLPAPYCRSSPPGCAGSPGFSFWSFPALNASWPGWKSAFCFLNCSGSDNQSTKIRGNAWLANKTPFMRFIIVVITVLHLTLPTEWTYRLDSHALQLYDESLFNVLPQVFLDDAGVFHNSRGGRVLLWCWHGLTLNGLLLS